MVGFRVLPQTVYSGHMVNTLSGTNGWNGSCAASHCVRLSARKLASDRAGFYPASFVVEVAQIIVQEAGLPDLVFNLTDTDGRAGEHGGEVDFAFADTDSAASRHAHGSIMVRVIGFRRCLVDPG